MSTAWQYANKCVDVTPEMAHDLILELQKQGIEYIVAPYEADAQMAYLFHTGVVDAIITEDSDLVLFGCKKIFFKMQPDGTLSEFLMDRIAKVRDCDFRNFSHEMIRHMCILSGCDYLDSIPKIGLKTAYRYISTYQTPERTLHAIKTSGDFAVPSDYEENFIMADMTFKHQRVYDPVTKQIVSLSPIPDSQMLGASLRNFDFLGAILDQKMAEGIALGEIDPISRTPFSNRASALIKSSNLSSIKQPKRKCVTDNIELLISAKKTSVICDDDKENSIIAASIQDSGANVSSVYTTPLSSPYFDMNPIGTSSVLSENRMYSTKADQSILHVESHNTILNYFSTPCGRRSTRIQVKEPNTVQDRS